MNHSSQIRMTNDEIRRNDEILMTKPANAPLRVFRHAGFGFLSSFVIQRLMQSRFIVPMHAEKRKRAPHDPVVRATPFCNLAERFLTLTLTLNRRTVSTSKSEITL